MARLIKWLMKALLVCSMLIILFTSVFFLSVSMGIFGPLPSKAELMAVHNEEASLVFSSDGKLLGKYFAENRTNISWDEVPEHLINALVATEDKRFYLHKGYDGRSYLRVFFKSILMGDRSSGGGSTLTQQLVKNLYGRKDHSLLSMPVNKLKEAIIATRMEDVYTKEEILLLYLNSVPFGEDVYGIEAAAKRYFDKHAAELSIQESAVLVGMLKANTYYNPRLHPDNALSRRNQIIHLMAKESFLSPSEADSLKKLELGLKYANYMKESPAGYFIRQVKRRLKTILENQQVNNQRQYDLEKDGLRIYTSLDYSIQRMAQEATETHLIKMQKLLNQNLERRKYRSKWEDQLDDFSEEQLNTEKKRELFDWQENRSELMKLSDSLWHYHSMLHAAVLVSEPSTGRVLAWVGGNHYRYLPFDMVYAKRQIASAIKPFIYAAALEEGLGPCTYLENTEKTYETFDDWQPSNYDGSSSDSSVAMWYALAKSMNLPTVDLLFKTGYDEVADMLRRFDLKAPYRETPAISLGALDVSLYEMVRAYAAIANHGVFMDDLVMIDKVTDASGQLIYERVKADGLLVISDVHTDQLTLMLEGAVNQGTGVKIRNQYGFKADLAAKTGTAQNYSNAWFMAYTPNLVVGSWVGARSPEVHFSNGLGSGSALALPISAQILKGIENDRTLNNTYLTDFSLHASDDNSLDCAPYFEKGLPGFIHRLTDKGQARDDQPSKPIPADSVQTEEKKPKKKNRFRRFIDKVFKGKKDK